MTQVVGWSAPVMLIALLATFASIAPQNKVGDASTVIVMILLMVFPAVTLLLGNDAKKRYRLLRQSAEAKVVDIFAEPAPHSELFEDENDEIPLVNSELVVVPETGLVLSNLFLNDRKLFTADSTTVANPRQASVTGPVTPARVALLNGQVRKERALSPDELRDLEGVTKQLTQVPWWSWFLFAYLLVGALSFFFNPQTGLNSARSLAFLVYDIVFVVNVVKKVRLKGQLKLDRTNGLLLLFEEDGCLFEVLASSGLRWTENGDPAPYRKVGAGLSEV